MSMKRFLFILASTILVLGCQKEVYHNITVSVNPAEGGSISPSSGPVLDGTSVSFKATPNGDYVFTGWSGSISGTENPKTVTVTQDMNVTANFALRSYPLTITIEGDGTVAERVISTKSEYQSGTIVELTASPSDHWLFDHWEGDRTGTTNPVQITVSSAKNVKAVFVEKTYPLNVEIEGEGAVLEKIIQTKATYQEGTVVELTANPSDGWSFDHWGGDLSGNDNPAQITVSSEKTVKAVFVKNNYSFNVKIVGPGAVDEYLVEQTKATVEYGKQVRLVAIPSDGAIFKGWGGDASGNDTEIIVQIDKDADITASFEVPVHTYPLPDLNQPSVMLKRFYPDRFTNKLTTYAGNIVTLDYNRDGYPDLITSFTNDEIKAPIRFFYGTSDGTLIPDPINDRKIIGLDECRKIIYGEYNGDGITDICIISHGIDYDPHPGDYPLILLSNSDGTYRDIRFPEFVGYFHGGTAGDFDNDGDTDIFFSDSQNEDSVFLINDGKGNFTTSVSVIPDNTSQIYTTELFDIDKDGYLDLFMSWPLRIIWGNGKSFSGGNMTFLPTPSHGTNCHYDFAFYDLDNDGYEEFIGCGPGEHSELEIQILDFDNNTFTDVTKQYFDNEDEYRTNDGVIIWINIENVDSHIYLVGRMDGSEKQTKILFELKDGKFVPYIYSDSKKKYENGICIYSENIVSIQGNHIDFEYKNGAYLGNNCIKFSNWPIWNGWAIDYADFMDFSVLEKNDYCLEFAIKNSDPDLWIEFAFETRLQTEPWYFPTYHYSYDAHEHKSDGTWELIQVPLSSLKCDEEWTGYYWNTIKTLNIMPAEYHGKDFYLDEIRIRKVIN